MAWQRTKRSTHRGTALKELIILADKPQNSLWSWMFCWDGSFSLIIITGRNAEQTLEIFSHMHDVNYLGGNLPKLFQWDAALDAWQPVKLIHIFTSPLLLLQLEAGHPDTSHSSVFRGYVSMKLKLKCFLRSLTSRQLPINGLNIKQFGCKLKAAPYMNMDSCKAPQKTVCWSIFRERETHWQEKTKKTGIKMINERGSIWGYYLISIKKIRTHSSLWTNNLSPTTPFF